ncbi:MAG: hypothetical protein AMXMBFR84_39780 [Candidatus Hydrogenedentota bacterium]
MTNHIRLIVVPEREESLGRALRDAHTVYAMRFNTRTQMTGHEWQGRFYSCVLDESHLWAAVRYVERNPIRAGMVKQAVDYPWFSARAHCVFPSFPSFRLGTRSRKALLCLLLRTELKCLQRERRPYADVARIQPAHQQ